MKKLTRQNRENSKIDLCNLYSFQVQLDFYYKFGLRSQSRKILAEHLSPAVVKDVYALGNGQLIAKRPFNLLPVRNNRKVQLNYNLHKISLQKQLQILTST